MAEEEKEIGGISLGYALVPFNVLSQTTFTVGTPF